MNKNDTKVPSIFYQITGIRAEVKKRGKSTGSQKGPFNKKARNTEYVTRWLGLQDSKYVALPEHWVDENIDIEIMQEAFRRGLASLEGKYTGGKDRFAKLPPGDARDDDPPENIRDKTRGLNYYYQGKIDNCLMGSFANAVAEMMGMVVAKQLLEPWNPAHHTSMDRWTKFQEHSIQVLSSPSVRVVFQKTKEAFHLQMDDSKPLLIQLRGKDGSETHVVTVFRNNIYDSASRYILVKSQAALEWCCGVYGYEKTLKTYVLKIDTKMKGKKRSRH